LDHVPGECDPAGIVSLRQLTVQGTVRILDKESPTDTPTHGRTGLKHDKTGRIILVPQPSNDPNDPLVSPTVNLAFKN
jgi:hypothetical protein